MTAERARVAAEAREAAAARAALRRQEEIPPPLDEQEPPLFEHQRGAEMPEWARTPARELSPQEEQALREQLHNEWRNHPPAEPVSHPPPDVLPRPREDETLVRNVIERGRSGRPTRTELLPIGKENAILDEGARRIQPKSAAKIDRDRGFWQEDGEGLRQLRRLSEDGATLSEMATHFGVSKPFITKTMKRHDIELVNSQKGKYRGHDNWDDRIQKMQASGMRQAQIARALGATPAAILKRTRALDLRENPESAEGMGRTPKLSDWEIGPDGTMTRVLRKRGGRVPSELPASRKASHEEVGYASVSPRAKQHCRDCTKFIPAAEGGPACKKVVGPILPGAWCRRFVRKS